MPIAKETLRIGFTVVANKGGYVSKDAVKEHGEANNWQVDDGPDVVSATSTEKKPDATRQAAEGAVAPKKATSK